MLIINKGVLTLLVSEDIYHDYGFVEAKEIRDSFKWQGISNWRFPTPHELSLIKEQISHELTSITYWGISDIKEVLIQKTDKDGLIYVKEPSKRFIEDDDRYEEVPNKIFIDDLEQLNTSKDNSHGVILVKVLTEKDMNKRNFIIRPLNRNNSKDKVITVVFSPKNAVTIKTIAER